MSTVPGVGRVQWTKGTLWTTQSDSSELTTPVLWKFCVGIWEQLVPGSLKHEVPGMSNQTCPWDPGQQVLGG